MLEILIIAGIVWFVHFSFQEGNILEKWYYLIEPLGEKWAKVLGMCLVCFGFWFGSLICLLMGWSELYVFPALMIAEFFNPVNKIEDDS